MSEIYRLAKSKNDESLARAQKTAIRSPKKSRTGGPSRADQREERRLAEIREVDPEYDPEEQEPQLKPPPLPRNVNRDRKPRRPWYPSKDFSSAAVVRGPTASAIHAARGSRPTHGLHKLFHARWAPLAKIESYGDEVSCQSLLTRVGRPPLGGSYWKEAAADHQPASDLEKVAKDLHHAGALTAALLKGMGYTVAQIQSLKGTYPHL